MDIWVVVTFCLLCFLRVPKEKGGVCVCACTHLHLIPFGKYPFIFHSVIKVTFLQLAAQLTVLLLRMEFRSLQGVHEPQGLSLGLFLLHLFFHHPPSRRSRLFRMYQ